jgi:hypothetical protein
MTAAAYELETVTAGVPEETQRYYRISQGGRVVLDHLRAVLDGKPGAMPKLLDHIEVYLQKCSEMFAEAEDW